MSRMGKTEAIRRLNDALNTARALQDPSYNVISPEFEKWRRDTRVAIKHIFGDEEHVKEFSSAGFWSPIFHSYVMGERSRHLDGLNSAIALLESMVEEIENYWPDDEKTSPLTNVLETNGNSSAEESARRSVFIVHGRDEGAKSAVARFLEKLDLQPVILDEQANRGLTIIEKFESHSDVGFAIVLLTPDDEGALRGDEKSSRHRARQNVIFELGFFIGRLGRKRVCALTKGSAMEIPSDYSGVVYIPLDDGGAWRYHLVKELKSAGLDVDANRAL